MATITTSHTSAQSAPAESRVWHTQPAQLVLDEQGIRAESGLTAQQAAERLVQFGPNELVEKPPKSPWAILYEQMTNPLVLLLIGAAGISLLLGKWDSFIAILAIVILNAVLGVVQEYRAEQAMAALKKMSTPSVRVRRDGVVQDVAAASVVPGDLVLLEAGSTVPADARLIEAAALRVQEASLTGESQPVEKDTVTLSDPEMPLGDRHNMVYMGTAVTYGRGTAVVVATGMRTQLGRIAELIQNVDSDKTPLQRRLDELGRVLFGAGLVVMAIAFVIGVITGVPLIPEADGQESVLLNAVAIAVAVVPEGLPAVVTIALALGAQRMLRRRALIRKLAAVETLGSVTTIASDKTGTLTENRMTVRLIDVADKNITLDELVNGAAMEWPTAEAQLLTLIGGALCNDAILQPNPETGAEEVVGDPTEAALLWAARRYGLNVDTLQAVLPRVAEVPFDSGRKRMSTIHRVNSAALTQMPENVRQLFADLGLVDGDYIEFIKGGVDNLLSVSRHMLVNGSVQPLTDLLIERITLANNEMASRGLRVLGVGYRVLPSLPSEVDVEHVEVDVVFVGMVGIIDPPRAEVAEAVQVARSAGIRPIMITGDHPLTAYAIARDLNIAQEGEAVLTGTELNRLSETELQEAVKRVNVFARVSPENKLQIVNALQANGEIAAMTGDGVNDAPALKRANIGVAMGITGTAVSKEASDMVLLDDNFATIVASVEEGRTIYDNVRRFIKYLLASNTGELFVLLSTQLVAGLGLPLTTLQILWMNLITDGVPALALGVEKPEPGAMKRPPYAPNESLFGRGLGRHILLVGGIFGMAGLLLGVWAHGQYMAGAEGYVANTWNTMVFMFLTLAQMGHALGLRSHRESIFTMNFFSNPLLLFAIGLTVVTQLAAVYLPFFNGIFNTTPLTLEQLLICALLTPLVFVVVEFEKLLIRRGVLQ
ncbi:MAG: cation-translocating P-type ATPase [Aggregatilineales bacterium]